MTTKIALWVAIIFFVLCGGYFAYKSLTLKPKIVKETVVLNPITGETTKIGTFVDSTGISHTTFKSAKGEGVMSQKDFLDETRPPMFADTVASIIAQANQIISVLSFKLSVKDDSLQAYKVANSNIVRYKDKYATISYTPAVDTTKVGTFDLAYNNTLTVTEYDKRNKVLGVGIGQKYNYTDVGTEDIRASINGVKTIQIKKQVPFFGVRGQLMTGYSFNSKDYAAGVGLRVDLGRVSFLGSYNYSTHLQSFRSRVGVTYDVFRF